MTRTNGVFVETDNGDQVPDLSSRLFLRSLPRLPVREGSRLLYLLRVRTGVPTVRDQFGKLNPYPWGRDFPSTLRREKTVLLSPTERGPHSGP